MRQFLFAAIAGITTLNAASAADPPRAFSWTGFYIGAHGGVDWASGPNLLFTDPNAVIAPTRLNTQNAGMIGGVHAGYNWQFAPAWTIGVEGDFSSSSLSNKNSVNPLFFGGAFTANTNLETHVNTRWLASVRGRLGFVGWRNTMFYVTGGAAWADVRFTGSEHNDPPTFFTNFRSTANSGGVRIGYVVGGGAEVPLSDHFLFRAEYLFYQFDGATTAQANLLPNPGAFPRAFVYNWSDVNINVVRLGLAYKF